MKSAFSMRLLLGSKPDDNVWGGVIASEVTSLGTLACILLNCTMESNEFHNILSTPKFAVPMFRAGSSKFIGHDECCASVTVGCCLPQ